MVLEKHGVVVIREGVFTDRDAIDPFIEEPLRRRAFVHGHDAECEGLSLGLCQPNHVIHQIKVVSPLGWLKHVPGPSEIGDGLGGILLRGRKRFSRTPSKLEIGESHARVVEDIADLDRPNRYRLGRCNDWVSRYAWVHRSRGETYDRPSIRHVSGKEHGYRLKEDQSEDMVPESRGHGETETGRPDSMHMETAGYPLRREVDTAGGCLSARTAVHIPL